jgi:ABC-type amino acid transport substrate-binding protein
MSGDLVALAVFVGLLFAVYLLPPDTSLAQVREAGLLRACVPTSYPPLVTGEANAPGIDVELLRELAKRMDVGLSLNSNSAMGRDFNPRNWGVTRAQCEIIAGGVVGSVGTRSFLEITPAYTETGWAMTAPTIGDLRGKRVGVFTGISGLDRLALSRYLREREAQIIVVPNAADLADGIARGRFDVAITEALLARRTAAAQGWPVAWLPGELGPQPLVYGLWKGDLTLKREIVSAFDSLMRDGTARAIIARYAPQ